MNEGSLAVLEGGVGGVPARGGSQVDLLAVARQAEAAKELGRTLIASGFLPDAIKTPEQVVLVVLKGQELGLPPVYSLSHIHVVKGKPAMSAEAMRALVQRAGHTIRVLETTRERAVVEGVRRDDPGHATRISYDEEDVRVAGLAGQSGHKSYPAALKLARATSALCRAMFADAIGGISYVPEELGAEVDEEGRVVEARPAVETAEEDSRNVEAEIEVEGEAVVEADTESPDDPEHERWLAEVDRVYDAIPQEHRPVYGEVMRFADKGTDWAKAALRRLRQVAAKHGALPPDSPNPDAGEADAREGEESENG